MAKYFLNDNDRQLTQNTIRTVGQMYPGRIYGKTHWNRNFPPGISASVYGGPYAMSLGTAGDDENHPGIDVSAGSVVFSMGSKIFPNTDNWSLKNENNELFETADAYYVYVKLTPGFTSDGVSTYENVTLGLYADNFYPELRELEDFDGSKRWVHRFIIGVVELGRTETPSEVEGEEPTITLELSNIVQYQYGDYIVAGCIN